jgi:hypothetical protein
MHELLANRVLGKLMRSVVPVNRRRRDNYCGGGGNMIYGWMKYVLGEQKENERVMGFTNWFACSTEEKLL